MTKNTIPLLCFLLGFLLLSACGPSVWPENLFDEIIDRKHMNVGILYNNPPFAYIDKKGDLTGFEVELMEEIGIRLGQKSQDTYLETMGIEVNFVEIKLDNYISKLESGEVDVVIANIKPASEEDTSVDFTIPYYKGAAIALPSKEERLLGLINDIIRQLLKKEHILELAKSWDLQ